MQVFVILHFSGIPGHNKHRESDYDGKEFNQSMEKHVTIPLAVNKNQYQADNTKCSTIVTVEKRGDVSQGYKNLTTNIGY